LRELESKYPDDLVVIGVHSGKYHAERVTTRITDASIRLGAIHPVLNDRQFRTWRSYAVSAWPTLVAIDPAGYVVGMQAGEFTAEMLVPFIDGLIDTARERGTLRNEPIHFAADTTVIGPGLLKYPGKVVIDGDRVAIADSGNHRVLAGRLTEDPLRAVIEVAGGSGSAGFDDGLPGRFTSPQGMAFGDGVLYIADAGNHSVRTMDLESGEVRTLAGIGRQMRTRGDQQAGAMSSPWDVALADGSLFIAMAGTHQLWAMDLDSGAAHVHSGTGGEDIRDGDHANALLAQPMGLIAHDERIYFADSESSAIRWADTARDGRTGTIVGTGLFDFGDVDGAGDDVRLQHPQGIALHPGGGLLVADSYNDCIKHVDPESRSSTAWLRGLHEPGGISCSATHAYVADTNAHRIVAVDLATGATSDLKLEMKLQAGSPAP
jgi:DNA-binding beta-propeller fold protein YncE